MINPGRAGYLNVLYDKRPGFRNTWLLVAMLVAWFASVVFQVRTHILWRDEVKALSEALQARSVFAMIGELHGESHPAAWYLLLRAAHSVIPHPQVLPAVSVAVATAATAILLWRSPFSYLVVVLILVSRFSLFEYSVMARNYGIGVVVFFLFAVYYRRKSTSGWTLGLLLFLLANTNLSDALLTLSLLLFWFIDLYRLTPEARGAARRVFVRNAIVAILGVIACLATMLPTYHDAAVIDLKSVSLRSLANQAIFLNPWFKDSLLHDQSLYTKFTALGGWPLTVCTAIVMFGSTLGLIRHRAAFVTALTSLVGYSFYFALVYPGQYRHHAVWIVFLLVLYWLAAPTNGAALNRWHEGAAAVGTGLFIFVLALQVPDGIGRVSAAAIAANRIKSPGEFVMGHPELQKSVVVADPDFILETLPYYVDNPTYLIREQRYGNVVHFTRQARLRITLTDVLNDARRIKRETGRLVVILMGEEIGPISTERTYMEGYDWTLVITPEQAREFLASTRFIRYHKAPPETDEDYYAYMLKE